MTPIDSRWWLESEEDKHDAVLRVVRHIRQNQEYRKVQDLLHASLYGNIPMLGFGFNGFAQRSLSATATRLSLNVVRNMVGAVTSKVASKNKPKPTFLTEGGNYDQKQKAEKLEKFVGGVFYESGVYGILPKSFRDCAVYGTGALKVYEDGSKVCVERVIPWELVIDDGESLYGEPRNIYQRKYVDRLVLKSMYADDEDKSSKIERAPALDPEDAEYAYQTTADQVLVTEAWHLSEDGKTPGRHTIVIVGCTLLDEEWEGPFPFSFLRWSDPIVGFFGVGLAEELMGIQQEINKLLLEIQKGHHLIKGHYLVESGSKVTAAHINNDLAAIVKYTGTAPQYVAPSVIAPDVYQHLWNLYTKAFEISGISQLNATGQKPAGLNSGAAQRAYQDIQTERFLEIGQAYEEFVIEVARQVIRCAKKIGGKYRVKAVDKGGFEAIDWSEVDLDEDSYVIRVYPTSLLPTTPSGKLSWAQDMINSGAIPPEDVLDIVDFPDTEAYAKRKNAPRKLIERNISHMLKTGEYVSPEPFDNHQLALRLVNEAYHEARLDGVPDKKLEQLRQYMADSQAFLAPPPAPPMGPAGDASAPGMAPPPPPGPAPGPMPQGMPAAA